MRMSNENAIALISVQLSRKAKSQCHFLSQIIIATFIAACSCARLDSNYLPPASAPSAGGAGAGLAAPGFGRPGNNGNNGFGAQQSGYGVGNQQNGFGSGSQQSGFGSGAPQGGFSGGSSSSQSSFGSGTQQGSYPSSSGSQGGFGGASPAGPQQPPIAILSYENVNNGDGSYHFSYETENGIKAQEQGELKNKGSDNAIQTVSGSYSYTAPDGQLITVTYIADENGFQPTGDHLPTPPPIPKYDIEPFFTICAAQHLLTYLFFIGKSLNHLKLSQLPRLKEIKETKVSFRTNSVTPKLQRLFQYTRPLNFVVFLSGYPSGNNNYNGQQNNGYPSAPSNNDYPSAPVNNGYPSAPAQNGFPNAPAQGGFPNAPAPVGRPGNQYVPPSNQPRPSGNGGFNQQSGYKY